MWHMCARACVRSRRRVYACTMYIGKQQFGRIYVLISYEAHWFNVGHFQYPIRTDTRTVVADRQSVTRHTDAARRIPYLKAHID